MGMPVIQDSQSSEKTSLNINKVLESLWLEATLLSCYNKLSQPWFKKNHKTKQKVKSKDYCNYLWKLYFLHYIAILCCSVGIKVVSLISYRL